MAYFSTVAFGLGLDRRQHKHVVLIHGNWSRGQQLAAASAAFDERGYTAHAPTLRHHELPMEKGAPRIASLNLRDFTDDLVRFVNSLDSSPLLVGHAECSSVESPFERELSSNCCQMAPNEPRDSHTA